MSTPSILEKPPPPVSIWSVERLGTWISAACWLMEGNLRLIQGPFCLAWESSLPALIQDLDLAPTIFEFLKTHSGTKIKGCKSGLSAKFKFWTSDTFLNLQMYSKFERKSLALPAPGPLHKPRWWTWSPQHCARGTTWIATDTTYKRYFSLRSSVSAGEP